MNIAQAKKRLQKLFGKAAAWRIDERAPNAEQREAARAALPDLRAKHEAAKEKREARRRELLADPEYVALLAQEKVAREVVERTCGTCGRYRVTFGTASSLFFSVKGEGDNWEDAFADYERRNGSAT